MTTTIDSAGPVTGSTRIRPASAQPPTGAGQTRPLLPDVLRSEWTKMRSVRSTYWTLFIAVVATVGLSALLASVYVNRYSQLSLGDKLDFHPVQFSLNGLFLAQFAIAVLGVLVITSEFGTGMIRSTFAAVPQRRTVLAAKAIVFGAVSFVVAAISVLAAFFIGQTILSSKHIEAHIGDPGVIRQLFGATLYVAVLGLLALGLGAIIRHSSGAIASIFAILFGLPLIASALPSPWDSDVSKYLPGNAGEAMFRTMARGGESLLSPWAGTAVFLAYAAVVLAIATVLITRRDP